MKNEHSCVSGVVRLKALVCVVGLSMGAVSATSGTASAQPPTAVQVDCTGATPSAHTQIRSALASMDPTASNLIVLTGDCHNESLEIRGFNQLTIDGRPGGATISHTDAACSVPPPDQFASRNVISIFDSAVQVFGVVIRGGQGLSADRGSVVTLSGVTVEKSRGNGINVGAGSQVNLQGRQSGGETPNTIQDNCGAGMTVRATGFGSLNFGNTIQNNSVGLAVDGTATLGGDATARVVIQNQSSAGVRVLNGRISLGQVTIQDNGSNPPSPGQAGIWAAAGATVDAGAGGLQVLDNAGPGIWAQINSNVVFGAIVNPGAPGNVTISGNSEEGLRLTQMSAGLSFSGTNISGNGGADATCDDSSQLFNDGSGIVVNNCKIDQPKKK